MSDDVPLVARVFPELFLDEDDNLIKSCSVPVGLSHILNHKYVSEDKLVTELRKIMRNHERIKQKLNGEEVEDPNFIWFI